MRELTVILNNITLQSSHLLLVKKIMLFNGNLCLCRYFILDVLYILRSARGP